MERTYSKWIKLNANWAEQSNLIGEVECGEKFLFDSESHSD